MKKNYVTILTGMALCFSLRADIIYPDGHVQRDEPFQIKKLSVGVANVLTFGLELPKAIFETGFQEGTFGFEQLTLGVPRGFYKAFQRLGSGLYDLATVGDQSQSLHHLEPTYLGFRDVIPGYNQQFNNWVNWETTDTPAFRLDTPDSTSWH